MFPYAIASFGHRQIQSIQWVQSFPHIAFSSSMQMLFRGQIFTYFSQEIQVFSHEQKLSNINHLLHYYLFIFQ